MGRKSFLATVDYLYNEEGLRKTFSRFFTAPFVWSLFSSCYLMGINTIDNLDQYFPLNNWLDDAEKFQRKV